MGLEEKIHRRIKYHTGLYKSNLTKEISEIADDYAIEFSNWVTINYPNQRKFLLTQGDLDGFYTTQELLKIFKKEKGL